MEGAETFTVCVCDKAGKDADILPLATTRREG